MKSVTSVVVALALAASMMPAAILVSATVEAQQGTLLTLSCKGTVTTGSEGSPQEVTMGIVVNFATHRVLGLQAPGFLDYPLAITAADDAMITFQGSTGILRHMRRHLHRAQFVDEILGVISLVGTQRDRLRPIGVRLDHV